MAMLYLVRGIPGSGKSTFAKQKFPGILHLENDMFHMHHGQYDWHKEHMPDAIAWCISMTRAALQANMDVVVANTFAKWRYVHAYEKIALEYGAGFEVYRCVGHFKNVHRLDDAMVRGFEKGFEDFPGEVIVQPYENTMKYEVFSVLTNRAISQFAYMHDADKFIAFSSSEDQGDLQIRAIECT